MDYTTVSKDVFEKKYKFGIDWLNGVLPLQDVDEFFDVLGSFSSYLKKDRWSLASSGIYNYKVRYLLNNKSFIQIAYNPLFKLESDSEGNIIRKDNNFYASSPDDCNNPYIFISISGDGIRYLQSIGGNETAFQKLICYLYANGFKASRFDVYCDILDKENVIVPLLKKSFNYFLQPRVDYPTLKTNFHRDRKNIQIRYSFDDDGKRFYNLQLGLHNSPSGMFRCYNKLVEVMDGRLEGFSADIFSKYDVSDYWYRLEYELHKDKAAAFFNVAMQDACETGIYSVNSLFASVASEMFSPVVHIGESIRKLYRAPVIDVWASFIELISTKLYILAMSGVPFVPCDRRRLRNNSERIKGYVVRILFELKRSSDAYRRQYLLDGLDLCFNNKKNNLYFDELDKELNVSADDFSAEVMSFA